MPWMQILQVIMRRTLLILIRTRKPKTESRRRKKRERRKKKTRDSFYTTAIDRIKVKEKVIKTDVALHLCWLMK